MVGGGDFFMEYNSLVWLEKFMFKYGMGFGRLMCWVLEINILDSRCYLLVLSVFQLLSVIFLVFLVGYLLLLFLLVNKSDEEKESMNSFMDFMIDNVYKYINMQSNVLLNSVYIDYVNFFFFGSVFSFVVLFGFLLDFNIGGFLFFGVLGGGF